MRESARDWQRLFTWSIGGSGPAAGSYAFVGTALTAIAGVIGGGILLDPRVIGDPARRKRVRLDIAILQNGVLSGQTFTPTAWGPETSSGAAAPVVIGVGPVAAQGPVTSNPPINSTTLLDPIEFELVTAGGYFFGMAIGNANAANSQYAIIAALSARNL